MMTVINMTPHDICIIHQDAAGEERVEVIPVSGQVARCEMHKEAAAPLGDIPVYHLTYGPVVDLPPAEDGTFYIVSSIVAQSLRHEREDLLVPVDFVRNGRGEIIGCRALGRQV